MIKKSASNFYVHCSNLNELEYELTDFDGTNQKLTYLQSFQKHIKSIIPGIEETNYVLKYNTKMIISLFVKFLDGILIKK